MDPISNAPSEQLASCQLAFEQANRKAEENAAAARDAREELQYFVYAASHDLQQPLRTVATYAQLLQREYPNDERAREFIGVIIDGANEMSALIRDLLNYSRTGNSPERTSLKLNASLQWALFNLAAVVRESGAQITNGDLPEALADERQLATVFENLIGNAVKYRGAEPPRIEIDAEEGDGFHIVSVRDNGVGIKSEFQEKVFEPFKRLHGKEVPGSGLGLSICRKIVRAHGGRIWIESDGKQGSTVKFTIPV